MSIPIFVSTTETQGQRDDDFCSAPEGEIVVFSVRPCASHAPDDRCGCDHSMTSIDSLQSSTTTMKVVMFDGTYEDLDKMIVRHLRDDGWVRPVYVQKIDNNFALRISKEAAKFSVGTIVEYRNGVFLERTIKC